jgi:DNA-binding CsgD family transcriptional regulator
LECDGARLGAAVCDGDPGGVINRRPEGDVMVRTAARQCGQGGGNVVTVPGSDGWVTLHAWLPEPSDDGRVAVVLERATGTRSATVRLEALGAAAREREVSTLLARGLSRAEMAKIFVVSPHTVEDHVKNLYEILGVASRKELVARGFLDEHLLEVVRQTPLTSRGRFDRE